MPPVRTKSLGELVAHTRGLPEGSFFLEHAREKEIQYIERSYLRWRDILKILEARVPNSRDLTCLDVGCSPFTFWLKDYFREVSALDLSAAFRGRCEAMGITLHAGGVTSDEVFAGMPKVDCVICLEVLEHLHANPVKVLERLRSALRRGGPLILSTPNMMCFANRGLMLLNRKLRHFAYPPFSFDDGVHGYGHDRVYMPAELKEYFAAAGFERVETLYQPHVFGVAHHSGRMRRLWAWMVIYLKRAVPSFRDGLVMVGWNGRA